MKLSILFESSETNYSELVLMFRQILALYHRSGEPQMIPGKYQRYAENPKFLPRRYV